MERLFIPYPEFKLGEIIDPEETNSNNADIMFKVNQIVDKLNSIFVDDGGEGGIVDVEIRGNVVKIKPIAPFTSDNVEDFLTELMSRLKSFEEGGSGASLIGSEELEGIDGNNVQAHLKGLYDLVIELTSDENINAALEQHKSSGDHDERYYKKDEIDGVVEEVDSKLNNFEQRIENIPTDIGTSLEKFEQFIKNIIGEGEDVSLSINTLRVLDEDPPEPKVGEIWMLSYIPDLEGDSGEEGEVISSG